MARNGGQQPTSLYSRWDGCTCAHISHSRCITCRIPRVRQAELGTHPHPLELKSQTNTHNSTDEIFIAILSCAVCRLLLRCLPCSCEWPIARISTGLLISPRDQFCKMPKANFLFGWKEYRKPSGVAGRQPCRFFLTTVCMQYELVSSIKAAQFQQIETV
jgi:hypothetical protein